MDTFAHASMGCHFATLHSLLYLLLSTAHLWQSFKSSIGLSSLSATESPPSWSLPCLPLPNCQSHRFTLLWCWQYEKGMVASLVGSNRKHGWCLRYAYSSSESTGSELPELVREGVSAVPAGNNWVWHTQLFPCKKKKLNYLGSKSTVIIWHHILNYFSQTHTAAMGTLTQVQSSLDAASQTV